MGVREGHSWKSLRGRNTVRVSVSFLSDPAKVRGRESIWPPSLPSFSSLGAELWFSSMPCQNHATVYILESRAPRVLWHPWKWAFYSHPTSHDKTPLFSSPVAFPTLTFFCLFLIGCGWPSEQNILEPARGGGVRKSGCS